MRRVSRDESRESVLTKEDMKNKLTCKGMIKFAFLCVQSIFNQCSTSI